MPIGPSTFEVRFPRALLGLGFARADDRNVSVNVTRDEITGGVTPSLIDRAQFTSLGVTGTRFRGVIVGDRYVVTESNSNALQHHSLDEALHRFRDGTWTLL